MFHVKHHTKVDKFTKDKQRNDIDNPIIWGILNQNTGKNGRNKPKSGSKVKKMVVLIGDILRNNK